MDAVEYIKTLRRLCISKIRCDECPLLSKEESCCIADVGIDEDIGEDAEKVVQIVEQWAKDHPVKTRQSELLKIFPYTKMDGGIISFCPISFLPEGEGDKCCRKNIYCNECRKEYWLTEVSE